MVERVQVGADEGKPQPTGPNDAALAAKATAAATPKSGTPERPAWLPEKFTSPEALAQAYAELEKKQSAPAAKPDPTKPIEKEPATEGAPEDATAAATVEDAGLDFDDLGRQVSETGDISKEARAALIAKGIPEATIDAHIEGVKAQVQVALTNAYAAAGGEEQFNTMREWATKDASEAQLHTYNTLVQKGDQKSIAAAMQYLKGIHEEAVGKAAPRRLDGSANAAPSNDVYTSRAQVTADMKNPLYKTDPAFRAQVESKIKRSSVL